MAERESERPPGAARVVVDAMGGDRAPREPVEAAVRAVRERRIPVTLVGRSSEVEPILRGLGASAEEVALIDAPEVVAMEEHAVAAVRRKARASILVGLEEVREGRAEAFVSAGNSGAVVAAALFTLGRVAGVDRPGIAIPFPTRAGGHALLIDAGAVADPRPAHLVQFAHLATAYLRHVVGVARPRVGLLSNGEEPGKGNHLIREAHALLAGESGLEFVGNVEGNEIASGKVDAVVCDGFTGNVALKTAEGVASLMQEALRRELTARWYTALLAAGLRPALRRAARRLDYREYGGAPLLGVRGVVFIAHGRSDDGAILNAIVAAERAARGRLAERVADAFWAREAAAEASAPGE